MKIQTEISIGELLDKASILKIKSEKISDINKKISIDKELIYLNKIISDLLKEYPLAEKWLLRYGLPILQPKFFAYSSTRWDINIFRKIFVREKTSQILDLFYF